MKDERTENMQQVGQQNCLNCGHELNPEMNFCPNCGQKNTDRRVPMKDLVGDFAKDYLTFDSKFFRSFIPLLFKPGRLTELFNSGKRVSFIPPIRLYIFVSFAYFFVLSFGDPETENQPVRIHETEEEPVKKVPLANGLNITIGEGENESSEDTSTGRASWIGNKFEALSERSPEENREMVNKLFSTIMFLLMPYFAWLLSLFFRKKKRFYVEHLVFSFHYHSFYFFVQTIALLLSWWLAWEWLPLVIMLLSLIYLYVALLKVYERSWWRTLFRFMGITVAYVLGIILFTGIGLFCAVLMT